ncbi:MAG: baseplate J/gp47 family protein, partial [Paraclostridium sp.]
MVFDVSNMDEVLRSYIVSVIVEHYPEIDSSRNSAFDDMFIKPMLQVFRPFVDSFNRTEIKSNLNNAEYMTEDELNEKGEGNYFIKRNNGERASTILTLSFANLNINNPELLIKIPVGAVFATSSGLEFQCEQEINLTSDDLLKLYNKNKMTYDVEVPIFALEIGTDYNVEAGEIIICKTNFSTYLVGIVNKSAVTNGLDTESNISYAARIKDFFISRQLGTTPGYRAFILESFEEVSDLYVSGYKDKYMQRDYLSVYDKETGSVKDRHIGGMVDIYLKGCKYDSLEATVTL